MRKNVFIMLALLTTVPARSAQEPAAIERVFQALRNDDRAALRRLVAETRPNASGPRGMTPLMYAAMYGTPEQVSLLLDAGAEVNARNEFNGTPLISAAGDPVKSRLLVEHGADVNARSDTGQTPLAVAVRGGGNGALVRLLLDKGADARAIGGNRQSVLLKAAATGDVEVMRLLLDHGADVNQASTSQGMSPLGSAVSSYDIDAVKLLLAHGTRIDTPGMDDHGRVRNGRLALGNLTPLMLAAPYGSPALIDLLLNAGSDVNAIDERGMTALMLAVASETQDAAVVKQLLSAGADVNVRSTSGETAFDWAIKFGNRQVIDVLKRAGARIGTGPVVPPRPSSAAPRDAREALWAEHRAPPAIEHGVLQEERVRRLSPSAARGDGRHRCPAGGCTSRRNGGDRATAHNRRSGGSFADIAPAGN